MLGDEFQQERNVGRSNNRPVLGAATRAYGKHLGEEVLVYRLAYNGDVVATGRDALPRDPAPHVQKRCKFKNGRS